MRIYVFVYAVCRHTAYVLVLNPLATLVTFLGVARNSNMFVAEVNNVASFLLNT